MKVDNQYKGEYMNPRKKQIMHAAHRLFIEKGYVATSVQDILDETQIAKGTFYNYFSAKSECLMAILDYVWKETNQKRRELARGKDKNDIATFVKQIAVRMKMNHENNLVAVFESVIQSDDSDFKKFIKRKQTLELQWVEQRIVEIYGPENKPYAFDQAVMLLGIIHHLMHVWLLGTKQCIDAEKVIEFALARMTAVIKEQSQSKVVFFPKNWLGLAETCSQMTISKVTNELITALQKRMAQIKKEKQSDPKQLKYMQFLIDEFQADDPRVFLIESVLDSLPATFEQSNYKQELREVTQLAWQLVDHLVEVKKIE